MLTKEDFHRIAFAIIFEKDKFDAPESYLDPFWDWVEDAAGQMRCSGEDWQIVRVDKNSFQIEFEGDHSHSGQKCIGVITADYHGKILSVSPS